MMPGSSSDGKPPDPPIAPALDDRKREAVTGPIKKPKASEVVKPTTIETKPKVPEARKIAPHWQSKTNREIKQERPRNRRASNPK